MSYLSDIPLFGDALEQAQSEFPVGKKLDFDLIQRFGLLFPDLTVNCVFQVTPKPGVLYTESGATEIYVGLKPTVDKKESILNPPTVIEVRLWP